MQRSEDAKLRELGPSVLQFDRRQSADTVKIRRHMRLKQCSCGRFSSWPGWKEVDRAAKSGRKLDSCQRFCNESRCQA